MNSKKILIFSTAYFPFVGGAEVAIKEITDRIPDIRFDLITARLDRKLPKAACIKDFGGAKERIGNVNIFRIGFGIPILDKLLLPFWGAIFAKRLNKINHYSSYWCMMVTFASGAAYIANIFSKNKAPVILTLQEGDSEEYLRTKWLGLIDFSWKLALKRSSIVTAISNYLKERAKRLGYKGEVKIIPNGVDVKKFELGGMNYELREETRRELGLGENDIGLITTSRLNVKNGVGDVIKALPKLPENIKFVILGEGELKEKLEKLVEDLEVSERVKFLGFVSRQIMPKYLKACDIFIRPSLSEGQGVSFMEAMAARLPVIATPVGGIVDFLHENNTGYFCQPEDPESIVDTIKRAISDPNKDRVVGNAYNMIREKYDWDLIAEQMKAVFEKP